MLLTDTNSKNFLPFTSNCTLSVEKTAVVCMDAVNSIITATIWLRRTTFSICCVLPTLPVHQHVVLDGRLKVLPKGPTEPKGHVK